MKIRIVTPESVKEDVQRAINLAEDTFNFVGFEKYGLRFNPKNFENYCLHIASRNDAVIYVFEYENRIIGSIAGVLMPWVLDPSQTILMQMWWWLDKKYRNHKTAKQMLTTLAAWGKSHGAELFECAGVNSPEEHRMRKLYKHFGFEFLESYYLRRI